MFLDAFCIFGIGRSGVTPRTPATPIHIPGWGFGAVFSCLAGQASSNFLHPVAPHPLRLHPRFLRCLHVYDYKKIFSTEWGERAKRCKQISRARGCNPGYKTKRPNPQAREAWEEKRGQGRKHQSRTGRSQGAWALPPWLWQTDLGAVVHPLSCSVP